MRNLLKKRPEQIHSYFLSFMFGLWILSNTMNCWDGMILGDYRWVEHSVKFFFSRLKWRTDRNWIFQSIEPSLLSHICNFVIKINKFIKHPAISISAAHLYDAVMVYSRAATEVIRKGGDIGDGSAIMAEIFNRTFRSLQGFDVRYHCILCGMSILTDGNKKLWSIFRNSLTSMEMPKAITR